MYFDVALHFWASVRNFKRSALSLSYSFSGSDLPSNEKFQVYPVDRIVPVGANTTLCCIVEEGKVFDRLVYSGAEVNSTRLSRRTYATTLFNLGPSRSSGTNVICYDTLKALSGTVVFVGCKMNKNWWTRTKWIGCNLHISYTACGFVIIE